MKVTLELSPSDLEMLKVIMDHAEKNGAEINTLESAIKSGIWRQWSIIHFGVKLSMK